MFKPRTVVPPVFNPRNQESSAWPWGKQSKTKRQGGPNLSIIMPSYQQGQFIEESIRSVLCSPYPNLELIIMDGGSSDETVEILEHYSSALKFWHSGPDQGQSHALSLAYEHADGELIGWLNSDDLYFPDTFYSATESLKNGYDCSYGDRVLIDARSKMIGWSRMGSFNPKKYSFNIASESFFWKKNPGDGITFDPSLEFAMDVDFICRMVNQKRLHYSRVFRGCFRCHEDAKSSQIRHIGLEEENNIYQSLYGHSTPNQKSPHPLGTFGQYFDLIVHPMLLGAPFLKHKLNKK
mgnify:CR=1 FL=1|jgi:hypothetical protein